MGIGVPVSSRNVGTAPCGFDLEGLPRQDLRQIKTPETYMPDEIQHELAITF